MRDLSYFTCLVKRGETATRSKKKKWLAANGLHGYAPKSVN